MHRQPLLNLLRRHKPADTDEQAMTAATIAFVEQHRNCFERSLQAGQSRPGQSRPGHVTGSAWIVSPDRKRVVLIHHRKLDRWLQPGGHADGDPDAGAVALREAQEETGLTSLQFINISDGSPPIFDVDIHTIPARGPVPEHLHYDIRFLLEADPNESFGTSEEIRNIQWIYLKNLKLYTVDGSIVRMADKIT